MALLGKRPELGMVITQVKRAANGRRIRVGLVAAGATASIAYQMRKLFKVLPANSQKRYRRYLWNICVEVLVEFETVKDHWRTIVTA